MFLNDFLMKDMIRYDIDIIISSCFWIYLVIIIDMMLITFVYSQSIAWILEYAPYPGHTVL